MYKRIVLYKKYQKITEKINHNMCLKELSKYFDIFGVVDSGWSGDVFTGTAKTTKNTKTISLHHTKKMGEIIFKVVYQSNSNLKEIKYTNKLKELYINKVTPHVCLLYSFHKCSNFEFRGANYRGVTKGASHNENSLRKEGPAYISILENAGVNLQKEIIHKKKLSTNDEKTALFQILYTLYTIHKQNIYHNDVYLFNITFKKIRKPLIWKYTIKGESFYCKMTKGYPILIDYGYMSTKVRENKNDYKDLLYEWRKQTQNDKIKSFIDKIFDEYKYINNYEAFEILNNFFTNLKTDKSYTQHWKI
tara:strand:- start:1946 stop:2860 length:915 start_codon:yes stop_codon:yes gene_type:complete